MRKASLAIALIVLFGACRRKEPEGPIDPAPLRIDVSGCAMVIGTACVPPDDRNLRLFIPLSSRGGDRIELHAFAENVPVAHAPPIVTNGGTLVPLRVPDAVTKLSAVRTSVDGTRSLGTVTLAASSRPEWYKKAQDLRQQGKLDEAAALARPTLTNGAASDLAAAEGLLARIELRRGDVTEATKLFYQAIKHDEEADVVSDRVDDALALVFLLHKRARRYAEARHVLDELAKWLERYPDGRAREPLYRAQVEWETGDTRTANRLLDVAIERASTIGATSIARAARQVRGMVACSAGTRRACLTALVEADRELQSATDATACERAEVAISLGFAGLEEMEVTHHDPAIGGKRLGSEDERGLTLLDAGCPDKYMRAVAAEHLALAAVYRNDFEAAKKRLDEAKAAAPEPRIVDAIFWLDVEARIAEHDEKIDDAIALQRRARLLAESSAQRTQAWRATTSLARLLEAKGVQVEALATYRAAEAILDDIVPLVPLGEGRAGAAADSAESMQRLAGLLLDTGKAKEALDVVRQARARLVRTLAVTADVVLLPATEREKWDKAVAEYRAARIVLDDEAAKDWKLAENELVAAQKTRAEKLTALRTHLFAAMALVATDVRSKAAPRIPDDETTLAIAHVGKDRAAVGFVVEKGKVRTFPIGELVVNASRPFLAQKLLVPATDELDRATRVRVLADDASITIDVHALPFHDVPLVVRVPVVYGVDLGARGAPDDKGSPLIVADPTGDLPSAREEGAAVARVLPGARSLVGRDATATRVRDELPLASLLHYAGHGSFKGRDGSESQLPLALGGALSFGDVLALSHGPRRVVLSGCETGRQEGLGQEASASLAQAFLVAGAETVIAPVRVVDDRATSAIATALHDADGGASTDLAIALARAQTRAIKDGRSGWEAFRAFVR